MVLIWIIIALWGLIAFSLLQQYADVCGDLSNSQLMIVCLIFIVGAPAFAIVNLLTALLDIILPEGWDNDDDDFTNFKRH